MEERVIVESSVSDVINAPIEKIDIPEWCLSLPVDAYQGCSPAHLAAGSATARDGRRISFNVEVIGGSLMVQHYVEVLAERHLLVLDSVSDLKSGSMVRRPCPGHMSPESADCQLE
jgi:hypothetical protein